MLLGLVLRGMAGMLIRTLSMAMRNMRVMVGLVSLPGLVVGCRLAMVSGCMIVMLGGVTMMLSGMVCRRAHWLIPFG